MEGLEALFAILAGMWLFCMAIGIFMIICMWKIFAKAGKPGWAVIVPIYNVIVMLEIAGKPVWWLVLYLIPFVNFIVGIIVIDSFVKAYGKSTGFTVGTIFLPYIFIPILAFDSSSYQGSN